MSRTYGGHRKTARTDVSGTKNDFLCNDMDWLSMAAFNALVGRMFGRPVLTQGVPYGECKHIRRRESCASRALPAAFVIARRDLDD